MGLVVWMARRRLHHGLPLSDLIQEGSIGLMHAVEKFDHQRGIKFNTYAVWWVRHSINRALSRQGRSIRVPVRLLGAKARVARDSGIFLQQHGRPPTERELSESTGLALSQIASVLSLPRQPLSLDAPVHGDEEARIGDRVADASETTPFEALARSRVRERVSLLLEDLKPREREVLRLRFGFDGGEPLTLAEVGAKFSLTRERIRQIEARALKKLRERLLAFSAEQQLAS
jgi:RNA polymerase primary sigma factor